MEADHCPCFLKRVKFKAFYVGQRIDRFVGLMRGARADIFRHENWHTNIELSSTVHFSFGWNLRMK